MPYPQVLILFDEIFQSLNSDMVISKLSKSYGGGKDNKAGPNSALIPCKYLINIIESRKKFREFRKTIRVFPPAVGNPTDEGPAVTTIIRLLYRGVPNDRGSNDPGSPINYRKSKPTDGQVQRQSRIIEVHFDA